MELLELPYYREWTLPTRSFATRPTIAMESSSDVKQGNQLDLLLVKAEIYSNFILANQKKTQDALLEEAKRVAVTTSPRRKAKKGKAATVSTSSSQKSKRGSRSATPSGGAEGNDEEVEGKEGAGSAVASACDSQAFFRQSPNLVGGTLMPYQVEGLQWLLSLWENGLNGILADEMGLGKTIQIIALIAHLRHNGTAGPYLIAGPLATITNWVNEFKKWLPSCPVLLYYGDKQHREELRKKHMPVGKAKELSFPVVVTSFDICIADRPHLEKYVWQYIILDEGHRIKNRNCKLIRELKQIQSVSRLLLTGTPIQNSLEELWSLLNFCSPMIFDDLEVFRSWFDFRNIGQDTQVEDILSTQEQNRIVTKMHEIMRPFVLRRLKSEVLGDRLPPKKEIVVYCGMTPLQREYYARVMDGTLRESLIELGVDGAKRLSQINPLMNQRKVCNHPFLFGDLKDAHGNSLRDSEHGNFLVMASGKFKLLHRMLPRLKAEGHRVLIFSQMTSLLDLLEDYLATQQHAYVRFDGSTKLEERQSCIDQFNEKDSDLFIFLISTRAGGLGINLTAADTVILFDSDWNPHQDSQAQDRCHRIGQQEQVVSYRFLTSGSVEIDMMKKQISKKKLERITIQGGDFRKAGRREGQQAVTLDELRALLEDDVKNLARMEEKVQAGPGKGSALVGSLAAGRGDLIQRDISDAELDKIMDRELLFATIDCCETEEQMCARPPLSKSASSPSLGSVGSTDADADTSKESDSAPDAALPLEGDMYDIVSGNAGRQLLSIS
ncbi:SNF2 family N-terminal domain-containing protein [Ochromonadaceae sp. CCMP2298]|nr:SNF2 family N-terminal domain-containing protein [Ochromonadaceae sp. CCMP2298]